MRRTLPGCRALRSRLVSPSTTPGEISASVRLGNPAEHFSPEVRSERPASLRPRYHLLSFNPPRAVGGYEARARSVSAGKGESSAPAKSVFGFLEMITVHIQTALLSGSEVDARCKNPARIIYSDVKGRWHCSKLQTFPWVCFQNHPSIPGECEEETLSLSSPCEDAQRKHTTAVYTAEILQEYRCTSF